jgi:hypothetical protein
MRQIGHRESDAILGAMRQVALASGHALTWADTTSVRAAGRYLLRRPDLSNHPTWSRRSRASPSSPARP